MADVLHSADDRMDGRQSTVFVLDDSDEDFQEKREFKISLVILATVI